MWLMPYTLRRASGTAVPPCADAMRRLSKISALKIIPEDGDTSAQQIIPKFEFHLQNDKEIAVI